MATLDEASRVHPNARWWIKADGCNIISGLEESTRLEWNGDVDFGTSEVQVLHKLYCDRLNCLDKIVADTSVDANRQLVVHTLIDEKHTMSKDIEFIAESKTMHASPVIVSACSYYTAYCVKVNVPVAKFRSVTKTGNLRYTPVTCCL